jgi:hypothetical protein
LVAEWIWKSFCASHHNSTLHHFQHHHHHHHRGSGGGGDHADDDTEGDYDTLLFALPRLPSFDQSMADSSAASSNSQVSEHSSERAVRRGWRRGAREANEQSSMWQDAASEYDVTTVTETNTDLTTGTAKKGQSKKRKMRKKGILPYWSGTVARQNAIEGNNSNSAGDAWMCGVCGKAFSTLHAADKHESEHIEAVIESLGWAGENGGNNNGFLATTPGNASEIARRRSNSNASVQSDGGGRKIALALQSNSGGTSLRRNVGFDGRNGEQEEKNEERFEEEDDRKPAAKRDEGIESLAPQFGAELPLGTLVPKPRARSGSEVRFDNSVSGIAQINPLYGKEEQREESLLLSSTIRDYVVLADEALVTVCKRAKPLIITKAEIRAERELALLAKDKAYYRDIAQRALTLKSNPSNRFRSDGEDLIGKVQNKFLDAYQLMKEGNGQDGLNDQYNRKKKESDSSNVIYHTER